jgi:proteasome alpha subunit
MYSPYDFNQSIAHRAEYVEERLKGGAPVVGLSYDGGVLLFTVKRTQRKIFEIYDKLMYGAIGNQADVEAVRLGAIDFAHQEGFSRSPDDVSIQRLVGFAISPPLKRSFGDSFNSPNVLRAIFAEVGSSPERDQFFLLNYDGEFTTHSHFAAIAGSEAAENAMREEWEKQSGVPTLEEALKIAAQIWRIGSQDYSRRHDEDDDDSDVSTHNGEDSLQEALKNGSLEAGILERNTPRESKFRLLSEQELKPLMNADEHR